MLILCPSYKAKGNSGFINNKDSEHSSQQAEKEESNILVCKCILQYNKQYCNLITKGQNFGLPVYITLLVEFFNQLFI